MKRVRGYGLLMVAILLLCFAGSFTVAENPIPPGEKGPLVLGLEFGQPYGFVYLIMDLPYEFTIDLPPGTKPVDPVTTSGTKGRSALESRQGTESFGFDSMGAGFSLSGSPAGAGVASIRPEPALDELDLIARDLGLR